MGKGDQRSRRGKIYRGSFGKSRPKQDEKAAPVVKARTTTTSRPTAGRTSRSK
jgi:30S ribosomal protein S31